MTWSKLTDDNDRYTDEEVEGVVASLVSSDSNLSWSYDDTNDILTVSLSDSISVNTLEANDSLSIPEVTSDPTNGNLWIRSDL